MNIKIPDEFLGKRIYLLEDEEITLNVENVTEYGDLPEFETPSGFERISSPEEWFDDLATSRVRLYNLNGMNIANEPSDGDCDYCKYSVGGELYFECKECRKIMCEKCFPEKTEEIAVELGAKNYAKRKDVLDMCFSHSERLISQPTLTELSGYDIVLFRNGTEIMIQVPIEHPRKTKLVLDSEHVVINWVDLPENFDPKRFMKEFLEKYPDCLTNNHDVYIQQTSVIIKSVYVDVEFPTIPERAIEFRNMKVIDSNIITGTVHLTFADNSGCIYEHELHAFSIEYNLSK